MKKIKLKFLRYHCLDRHHCSVQYRQMLDGLIRRFEEANPWIEVESTVMRNWYQLMYTLNRDLPDPEGPDVFHTCGGGELEDLVGKGLVHDLSTELEGGWKETFAPASLHPLKVEGKTYAAPVEQGCIFVWYDRNIFDRFGFSIPRSVDQLISICRELSGAGLVPFAVGNKERWPGAFFFSHLFHRIGGDDVFVSDFTRSPRYAEIRECFLAAAGKVLEFAGAGAFHESCGQTNYEEMRRLFFQGKAAMQLNGNRLLSYFHVENPGALERMGIFPFPQVNGGTGGLSTIFGGSLATYAVSERSRYKKEAVELLKSLTDAQAARDVIFDMGDIPAMRHIPYEKYPSVIHGDMAKSLGAAEKLQVHYFKSLPPKPAGVYLNLVAKLLTKTITPVESFETLENALAASSNAGKNEI
ncbi:MAG: extracellular solute-binding protein [Deltaproteobacteria bacterium]|nr:extracellular solute-binding protein [Deltaproteobacteria bacterium]